jgi:hypothetical protein
METAPMSDAAVDPTERPPKRGQATYQWPAWLELRRPGARFAIVLALLVITFAFQASGVAGSWVRLVTIILQGATLLAALAASESRVRALRVAGVVIVIGLISGVVDVIQGSQGTRGVASLLNLFLVAGAPVAIGRFLVQRRSVDLDTVLGAICVYVLFGMFFAYAFASVGYFSQHDFFAQHAADSTANYLYFSFVTLTTVGYGDLTAAGGLGRAVAILEALTGQLYLVTVVALVVSQLAGRRPVEGPSDPR